MNKPTQKLSRKDLYTLEKYSEIRDDFRRKVMKHKTKRRIELGPNVALLFEDRLTMQYQIQEMLRIERIFEVEGINEELCTYNPLIPDGSNLKATLMMEYQNPNERIDMLAKLPGIETQTWLQVKGHEKIYPFANEDMQRHSDEKTSSVHFVRFEFTKGMIEDLKLGACLSVGVNHPAYSAKLDPVPTYTRAALLADFY